MNMLTSLSEHSGEGATEYRRARKIAPELHKEREAMNEKIKPCPFCGSEDVELKQYGKLFGVECNQCDQPSWSYYTTKRKALEKWNSREDDWLFMGHVDVWESEA